MADDECFIGNLDKFLSTQNDMSTLLFPESNFKITKESRRKIKELLLQFQKEKLLEEQPSNVSISFNESFAAVSDGLTSFDNKDLRRAHANVLEVFTNILFEALQFVNIIPNAQINELNNEIEELKSVVSAFNNIKNNLIDFKNLVS
jgi:hypothetical protein